MLGGGSVLGLTGLAAVSPALAITAVIVAGAVAITAVITRALPSIIHGRSMAKTAKHACVSPQAERALRVLAGPEYLDGIAQAASVLSHTIGKPPEAARRPGDFAESSSATAEASPTPEALTTAFPKLAA
jgi:hypothetical protein